MVNLIRLGVVPIQFGESGDPHRIEKLTTGLPTKFVNFSPGAWPYLSQWPTGEQDEELLLAQPEEYPDNIVSVGIRLKAEGFILKGFPELMALRNMTEELWRQGVQYLSAPNTHAMMEHEHARRVLYLYCGEADAQFSRKLLSIPSWADCEGSWFLVGPTK